MNWYLAKVVYRIICGNGDHTAQFDEQLRIIQAKNQWHAYEKARQAGVNGQDSFFNSHQKLVQWKFLGVSDLHELGDLIDGAEIYSHVKEDQDADHYINVTHLKATCLQKESMEASIQTN